MLAELRYYSKMAVGIAKLLRTPMPADPEETLRRAYLNREQTFLDLVRRVVFDRPEHPYREMFKLAGCEPGDLRNMVHRDGLNAALFALRKAGVFLTQQEWKGKTPIVRSGREIPRARNSFANPLIRGWIQTSSSGSTGQPVTSLHSLESYVHRWCYWMLRAREFEIDRRALIEVRPVLPFPSGVNMSVYGPKMGTPVDRWFSVGGAGNWHYRAATHGLLTMARGMGYRATFPEFLPKNDFLPVARHIAQRRAEGRACVVSGVSSPVVRVASAAVEHGIDIAGTIFLGGGEALTPGKLSVFEAAGSRAFASYVSEELVHIGMSCQGLHGNSVHLLEDSIAAIAYRRPSLFGEGAVDSLHFTTLAPHASLVFINIEMDDEGCFEQASCDCAFSRAGFKTLITNIRSFGKMSAQGMTFHGTELQTVIEKEMPARLGGGPGDYQLVECEGVNQQTQMRLYVSPRAGLRDPARARETFLDLMRPRWGGALATRWWEHSGAIEAVIAEPLATPSGKVHAVRLLGAAGVQRPEAGSRSGT